MIGASISFFVSAGLSVLAALAAIVVRQPTQALAGFALALAGLILPLLQLEAPTVAALVLLAVVVVVVLLAGLVRAQERRAESEPRRARSLAFLIPAILGLLGFVWVLLATGSRQYVEVGATLDPAEHFGQEQLILAELAGGWLVPATLVGLLALSAVIAAVLSLVHLRPSTPEVQAE